MKTFVLVSVILGFVTSDNGVCGFLWDQEQVQCSSEAPLPSPGRLPMSPAPLQTEVVPEPKKATLVPVCEMCLSCAQHCRLAIRR